MVSTDPISQESLVHKTSTDLLIFGSLFLSVLQSKDDKQYYKEVQYPVTCANVSRIERQTVFLDLRQWFLAPHVNSEFGQYRAVHSQELGIWFS